MRRKRIDMHRLQEMVRLHRSGASTRSIAASLGMGRNTQRRYREALEAAGLWEGPEEALPDVAELKAAVEALGTPQSPPQEISTVASYRPQIEAMAALGAGPQAIWDRLRLEDDEFTGSLAAVKRMCRALRRERGARPEDVVLRVETGPGEIAQVDFGYVGRLFDPETGKLRKAYAFVMVLGFSRLMYVELVFDQTLQTWLDVHYRAFRYFGGVPHTVVPDNLKAAVTQCFFGFEKKPQLNRSYRELARHYGFRVDPTPPYSPHLKGKVESAVKYVKRNFFGSRQLETLEEASAQLALWLDDVANARTHGTTRKVPREVYEGLERHTMRPLPEKPYRQVTWGKAKVHPDCHIAFERRQYSVPFRHIGEEVWVRAQGGEVVIYADNEVVARHDRRASHRVTNEGHLPVGRRDLVHRSQNWWEQKAYQLGEEVGDYVVEIFAADDVYSQLRTVQQVVTHLETFPPDRAAAACRRARVYGSYSYRVIRDILRKGLDMEPLVPSAVYVHGRLEEPRFARSPQEILSGKEVAHVGE